MNGSQSRKFHAATAILGLLDRNPEGLPLEAVYRQVDGSIESEFTTAGLGYLLSFGYAETDPDREGRLFLTPSGGAAARQGFAPHL